MNKAACLAGIFAAVLCLRAGSTPGTGDLPPLIRRDLIRTAAPVFPKIKRDPFSRVAFVPDFAADAESRILREKDLPPANEPPPPPPPTVRYIGFIKYADPGAPVAIVLIDARAWAVAEGETMGNGWSALKITDKRIELRNPEGNTLVFIYEGERP